MRYGEFLAGKAPIVPATGIEPTGEPSPLAFDWQTDIVRWALRRGRASIFADCGLGKTLMQLEWARNIPGRVLILAPLAVATQTVDEAAKFGLPDIGYARVEADAEWQTTVTNYEMLPRFDPSSYTGIVLDESSILKAYDGKTRTAILDAFRDTPYRLACTATPAPNDYMELGNHSEFMGAMTRPEMLATFFVHDGGSTQNWRLKGHAEDEFWRWMASWAVMLRKPSDLGYDDDGFILPPLSTHEHTTQADAPTPGLLFAEEARTLQERLSARRASLPERVAATCALVNASDEPWVVWCNLNAESGSLARGIPDAVEVCGSMSLDEKESTLGTFSRGEARVIVTKPTIAGFGLNWQHCPNVAFVGLSDSWEQYYQAVRRCWRFGQTRPVHVHVIASELEGAVVRNIQRKEADAVRMAERITEHMADITSKELQGTQRNVAEYARSVAHGSEWTLHLGDCVEVVREMEADTIHYSMFSPPFASLYTYSNSDRDMGNCRTHEEFREHFGFLVGDLLRVTKPGRLVSFHCMNLPTSKVRDGVIGIRDFRGEMIRLFAEAGWIYHSEVCIWKDPVTAMQRTKALGLLHKQLRKDSCMSRMGIPDYVVTMRKPGVNPEPVPHEREEYPVSKWQRIASPIWTDIVPNDTLSFREAREHQDEKHICPLQLTVIRRCLELWTNPGDVVLSPFAGVGSEGYVSLEMGRRFVGVELKRSYWDQAAKHLDAAEKGQGRLDFADTE